MKTKILDESKGQLVIFGTILIFILVFMVVLLVSIGIRGGVTLEVSTDYEEPELNVLLINSFYRSGDVREKIFNYSVGEQQATMETNLEDYVQNFIATEEGYEKEFEFVFESMELDNDVNVDAGDYDRVRYFDVNRSIFLPFGEKDNVEFKIKEGRDYEDLEIPDIDGGHL